MLERQHIPFFRAIRAVFLKYTIMDPSWQLVFPTPIIDYIHYIMFVAEASIVVHYMRQKRPYGDIDMLEDFISCQQVLKFHTMLKLHGEGFHKFVPTICRHNQ